MKTLFAITFVFLSLVLSSNALATPIGDTVIASAVLNSSPGGGGAVDIFMDQSAVVSATETEWTTEVLGFPGSTFSIDLTDGGLTIIFAPGGFGSFPLDFSVAITDLDWVGQAGSLATMTQTSPILIGFLSNLEIGNDMTGGFMNLGSTSGLFVLEGISPFTATYSFTAVHNNNPPAIPEPSTILLFGSGLAGLGWWRYRKTVKS